jgi:hypothetical protein
MTDWSPVGRTRSEAHKKTGGGGGSLIPLPPHAKASGYLHAKQSWRKNVLAGNRPRGVIGETRVGNQRDVGNVLCFQARRRAQGSKRVGQVELEKLKGKTSSLE